MNDVFCFIGQFVVGFGLGWVLVTVLYGLFRSAGKG